MGWTSMHRDKGLTDRDFFEREFPQTLTERGEVVACGTKNNVFYAAVRERETNEVWALVVLLRRGRGHFNFSYKEMEETMGPVESSCPASVLEALTPTTNEYALQWRARCAARLERLAQQPKVKRGTRVRFADAMTFSNGDEVSEFVFQERNHFSANGMTYRISRWRERAFEVAA
jgi:hypothetical protein